MTYSLRNIIGVVNVSKGKSVPKALLFDYSNWPKWAQIVYDNVIMCHFMHVTDFLMALICYLFVFPSTFAEASQGFKLGWISKVIGFNLLVEFLLYGLWHHMLYASKDYAPPMKSRKLNKTNQYETDKKVGYISSTSGHLQREVFLTTVGFLISSTYQIVMTYLWANGYVPCYLDFWGSPIRSLGLLLLITYWREFHFYWVHRAMHPWWSNKGGLKNGDIGAFLYRHVHSLHHKSYNPGPWSGLSMHPVEHILYYSVTLLPTLLVKSHPLHFFYVKFHADVAPIGGHDGFGDPGVDFMFHYLHHSKFEVNYGSPLVPFDAIFGTNRDSSNSEKKEVKKN